MHHQGNQYVHVAFDRVAKSAVAGGNDDLKKIGADREVGWYSEDINHRRHPDVTGAAAKKSAAQSADERDQKDDQERDRDHRCRKRNHGRDTPGLKYRSYKLEWGFV